MSKNRNLNKPTNMALDENSVIKESLTAENTECSALNADATFEAISAANKPGPREFFKPPALDNPYGILPNPVNQDHRLWLAGMAMQGMFAHPKRYEPRHGAPANWHDAISEEAFELADAMLRSGGYRP